MSDPANTTPEMLMRAAAIAREAGLRYVYAGNLPGRVGDLENTRCHNCAALLIERYGYLVRAYRITARGRVPRLRHGDSRALGAASSTARSPPRRSCPAPAACEPSDLIPDP